MEKTKTLAALVAANEAIIRARNPQELYQRLCKATAEKCELFSTVIYLADPDTQRANIAEVAGNEAQEIRDAVVSVDENTPEGRGLIGTAYRSQQAQVTNDYTNDHRLKPWKALGKAMGFQSGAAFPLTLAGKSIGALGLFSTRANEFSEDFVEALSGVARNVSYALTNFEREREQQQDERTTHRQAKMYAATSATNEAILHAKTREDLYQRVCDAAVNGAKFMATTILIPEPGKPWVKIAGVTGMQGHILHGVQISVDPDKPEGRGLVGTAYRTRQPSISNDMLQDKRIRLWWEASRKAGVAAGAALPLTSKGEIVGVLVFYSSEKNDFDEEMIQLLSRLAENVSFAIEKFQQEDARQQLERRVAEQTQALEKALAAQQWMIANASHELRTPVNALRLLLDAQAMDGSEWGNIAPSIDALSTHMSQLVENLLLLDGDHTTTQGGPAQSFDLGQEIRATASLLGPLRRGSQAAFTIDAEGCAGVRVHGDLSSLRRILINLLSNAFKFTERGAVALTAHHELDAEPGRVTCRMRVTDTGQGIAADMQGRIFEAFVTSGAHAGQTGTGLGLAIARQLAINLNGALDLLRSTPNEGSTFECRVSFAPAPESKAIQAASAARPTRRRLKVLLVEDDPITAQAVQIIAHQLQHEIEHVSTPDDFFTAIRAAAVPYDVALIDHRLPGSSGLDIIAKCRAQGVTVAKRVILATADVTTEILEHAHLICDGVVTKPTTALYLRQLLGEGAPATPGATGPRPLVDARPLTTLSRCGAEPATLANMCELFYTAVNQTMERLHHRSDTSDLGRVVHQIRSSCASIGAVALSAEFQALTGCGSRRVFEQQKTKAAETFKDTQDALKTLLQGI